MKGPVKSWLIRDTIKQEKNNCLTMNSTVKMDTKKKNLESDHPVLLVHHRAAVVRVK